MKGSDVSKPAQRIGRFWDYRFPGWFFAAVVIVLIVGAKLLMS